MHFQFVLACLGAFLCTVDAASYACNAPIYKNLPSLVNYAPFRNYCQSRYPASTVTVYRAPSKRFLPVEANVAPRAAEITERATAQDPRQTAFEQLQSQGPDVIRGACACVQGTKTVTLASSTSATPSPTKTDNAACAAFTKNDPTCGDYQWTSFFSGQGVRTDRNTYSGNSVAGYPAYTNLFPGNLQSCDAISQCANLAMGRGDVYFSFDVHYLLASKSWECVQYVNQGTSADFRINDANVGRSFGYSVTA